MMDKGSIKNRKSLRSRLQAGNAIVMLFAAIGMAGVVTYGLNNVMRGPATTTAEVSRRTMAENNLIATSRLAVAAAVNQQANGGDCDRDGFVEPLPYRDPGLLPAPNGGGLVPMSMGASMNDPWGAQYGYCVWDPGTASVSDNITACGGLTAKRLQGAPRDDQYAIAVISAGKDGTFQTSCNAYVDANADNVPDTVLLNKPANSDDVVLSYTYAEANGIGGGEWKLKESDATTATIGKNLEVAGGATFTEGGLELGFNAAPGAARGLVLPGDPGDDTITGACTAAKEKQLRRNIGDGSEVPTIEICHDNAWTTVAGGASVGGQCEPVHDTWTARESNRNWRMVATSNDGVKLAAVVSGGQIYTSTDSGVTWTARDSSRNWWAIASSEDGTKLVATVNGGQIYTSTDSGATWTARDSSRNWRGVASSADGTKLVATVAAGQIYTSTNSGVTWTARDSNREWRAVASSADGTKLATVVNNGQIYTSTDSGATWTARETSRNWFWIASSSNGTKLIAANQGGQIYTSTDSGATWTARDSSRNWYGVASSADGVRLAATVDTGQIYTSADSGATWTARESSRVWRVISSSADGTKLIAADQGGKIYTSDGGCGGEEMSCTPGPITLTPSAANRAWTDIASSADGTKLVATVNGGQIYTSTSGGAPWTARDSNRAWTDVASSADGTKLVAAVAAGQIYTSSDSGVTWTARNSNRAWRTVASSADGTKLVATVNAGQIYTSTDSGVTWTARNSNRAWFVVTSSADGVNLAVTVNGGQIYTSSDSGVTWTARDSNRAWGEIASSADGTKLVATTTDGTGLYFSSNSGVTWSQVGNTSDWTALSFSNDGSKLFGAINGGSLYSSIDYGATWTAIGGGVQAWSDIANSADGTKLSTVVNGGQIYTADNVCLRNEKEKVDNYCGVEWTLRSASQANPWRDIAYGNGTFVAVAQSGTNQVMTSPDGITWTNRSASQANFWTTIAYGNGTFVAVSTGGTNQVMTSPDGITWTNRTASQANPWTSVTYGKGLFVAVSTTGTNRVMTSPDGITWTNRTAAGTVAWTDVTYGGGLFIATSGAGDVMTSPDGVTWTLRSTPVTTPWYDLTYGGGKYVITPGGGGTNALTSPDGITWTAQPIPEANNWADLKYVNGQFIAIASTGINRIMKSSNGTTWKAYPLSQANTWQNMAYGNNRLVAISSDGTNRVMTSECANDTAQSLRTPHPLDVGLVAHWKMDEGTGTTVKDSIGGHDGTFVNTPQWAADGPNGSNSLVFSKADGDYVEIDGLLDEPSAGTISAWVNPATLDTVSNEIFTLGYNVGLRINTGTNSPSFYYYNGSTWGSLVSPQAIGKGWLYLTVTFDDATDIYRLYVDGVLMAENTTATTIQYTRPDKKTFIGSYYSTYHMDGGIDDVRFYNRALSPGEVAALYDRAKNESVIRTKGADSTLNFDQGRIFVHWENSCALKNDKSAWCWGESANYESGNLNAGTSEVKTPVPVMATPNEWKSITGSSNTTCGLKLDGSAWCWGKHDYGMFDDGSAGWGIIYKTPRQMNTSIRWQQLSVGAFNVCGIATTGLLYCWGSAADGKLGNGTTTPDINSVTQLGTDLWRYVYVGDSSVCGIKTDGSLWCWGQQTEGRLGNGVSAGIASSPVAIAPDKKWKNVTMAWGTACGVTTDGQGWCWGNGEFWGLGNGDNTVDRATPQRVESNETWQYISAGVTASVGLTTSGRVYTWGRNDNGVLASGAGSHLFPTYIPFPGRIIDVSLYLYHGCAMEESGALWCWGLGTNGRLGDGGTTMQMKPVRVLGFPEAAPFLWNTAHDAISLNPGTTLALGDKWLSDDGSAKYFGFTERGKGILRQSGVASHLVVETTASSPVQMSFRKTDQTVPADYNTGLVAEWLFNEALGATVAATNVGTFPATSSGAGMFNPTGGARGASHGGVLECGGKGWVASNNATLSPAASLTLSVWINPYYTQDATIVSKTHTSHTGAIKQTYGIGLSSTGKIVFTTGYTGANNVLRSNSTINPNAWTHVVVSYMPGAAAPQKKIYINGVLDASATETNALAYDGTGTGQFFICSAGCAGGGCEAFAGGIDSLRLYNTQLTDDNILQLHRYQKTSVDAVQTMGVDPGTGALEIGRNNAAASNWIDTITPDFSLAPDGKIGIGTTTPAAMVDVQGGVRVGYQSACSAAGMIRYLENSEDECVSSGTYTWNKTLTTNNSGTPIRALATSADGKKAWMGREYFELQTTLDGGKTWAIKDSARYWYAIASSSDGTKVAAVANGYNGAGQIYTSTDSGNTWTPRDTHRVWADIASSADGTKLVASTVCATVGCTGNTENNGRIFLSTDSGATWVQSSAAAGYYNGVASSADGTILASVRYTGQIYISTNSGSSWTARDSSRNWQKIAMSADGTKMAAVNLGGYVYTSTNSGTSWTQRTGSGSRNWYDVAMSADGTKIAAVATNSAQVYTSVDSGVTWTANTTSNTTGYASVAMSSDGKTIYAASGTTGTGVDLGQMTCTPNDGTMGGTPPSASRTVFVTSTTYNGNMGGDDGANARCNARAAAAGLSGVFKAWNSDITGTPADNFEQSSVPYVRVDGVQVADNWADLTDGTLDAAISVTELGTSVTGKAWTNTNTNGTLFGSTQGCFAWNSGSSGDSGRAGTVTSTTSTWTNSGSNDTCNNSMRLYCFQQGSSTGSSSSNETCANGPIGTVCKDGSIYVGDVNGLRRFVKTSDSASGADVQWKTAGTATTGTGSTTDGDTNTDAIIAAGAAAHPAGATCRTVGADWYLPAVNELTMMYTNKTAAGLNIAGWHWSSTQGGSGSAYANSREMTGGSTATLLKTEAYKVRCMRKMVASDKRTAPAGCAETWTSATPDANSWRRVIYANGLFVAVAESGTSRVMTSTDGVSWTPRTASQANSWRGIAYGAGLYVAVAFDGTNRVMTSPDGTTWTNRSASQANQWMNVVYGNGLFVAVASSGTNRVMTSPDGITWTNRSASAANQWESLTYANGMFVAVSQDGANRVMTSPDGITWTNRTASQANEWRDVAYGNGIFVAVATSGTNRVMTSPDGITWTNRTGTSGAWRSVDYGNGMFVAVGDSGALMTSPDGITWTARSSGGTNSWKDGAYGNYKWVAVADAGTNRAMYSVCGSAPVFEFCDGSQWMPMGSETVDSSGVTNPHTVSRGAWTLDTDSRHTCSVHIDGTAWCWGEGSAYKLGNGFLADELTPAPVSGGGLWRTISAGRYIGCGIKTDGTAWCWGDGSNGRLGKGGTTDSPTPTQVAGSATWKQLDAGGDHACGIKTDGTAWCWGMGASGRLGNAGTSDQSSPVQVAGGSRWTAISAGTEHSCGIKNDGTAWCWGLGQYGRLGNAGTGNQSSPVQVSGAGTWIKISAGNEGSCGLKSDGTAWCWGGGTSGELGNNTTTGTQTTPVQVSGTGPWIDISAGDEHGCGIKSDGTAWCWGSQQYGLLGNGVTGGTQLTPVQVTGTNTWIAISAGRYHTCAVKSDSTAWCWGGSSWGLLGNGTDNPDVDDPVLVAAGTGTGGPSDPCSLAGGLTMGGYCWFKSASNQHCNAACAAVGGTCNISGTRDYAGSGGTNANCLNLLDALGGTGSGSVTDNTFAFGLSCNWDGSGQRFRVTSPTTACSAYAFNTYQTCACDIP